MANFSIQPFFAKICPKQPDLIISILYCYFTKKSYVPHRMDFTPHAYHFWYPRFRIQPFLQKIAKNSQKQTDSDILNYMLLFLKESYMFRIEWTLNHLHTTFGTRDSEFSHFFLKNNQKPAKTAICTHFQTSWLLFLESPLDFTYNWSLICASIGLI